MKRYLLFAGLHYYAHGGWGDFNLDFDTAEAAAVVGDEYLVTPPSDSGRWYEIVDTASKEVIRYESRS